MTSLVYRTGRVAMRCWCEVFLCGDDRGHLSAVAELALDEITRIERMLSRFDPASEVFRLNAAAANMPFRVSPELLAILIDGHEWWTCTNGAFDVTVSSTAKDATSRWNAIQFDAACHTITRSIDGITFDFGGYGKGYAIDQALKVTKQHGITSACLQAGTSSVVASGPPSDTEGWPIAIRQPDNADRTVAEWSLCHAGMSTSAVSSIVTAPDLIDPQHAEPITAPASCSVMATSATTAEVWSTALLIDEKIAATTNDVQRLFWQRFADGEWATTSLL